MLPDLLGFVEGDCSPDEAAAIQAWIAGAPRRAELVDDLRVVWRLTGARTRAWVVAGARIRLLPIRGRQRGRGRPGSPRSVGPARR